MLHASRYALLVFVLSLYCLLVLPRLLSYGMFLDGIVYASIARNMAEDYGSFWRPAYTATVYPVFYEHPPLGFWLQSWAYRLCGDAPSVETLWGFGAGGLILGILGRLWRDHAPSGYALAGPWFPMLLLVSIPMTPWILSNNMLENTMTVFTMASVYSSVCSVRTTQPYAALGYGLLAGLSAFLAFLVKGPVALFVLAAPSVSAVHRHTTWRRILLCNAYVLLAGVLSLAVLLATSSEARTFFGQYMEKQVLESVYGQRELSVSRLSALLALGREVIVPLGVSGLLTVVACTWRKATVPSGHARLVLYYLCLALISSLPLLVSPKQRRWYVFPSLPFYALAIAAAFNGVATLCEQLVSQHRRLGARLWQLSAGLVSVALLLMFFGRYYVGRHADFHHDFSRQPPPLEAREIISVIPAHLETRWALVANMQRQFKASLTSRPGQPYILSTTQHTAEIPASYTLVHPARPKTYLLFKRTE